MKYITSLQLESWAPNRTCQQDFPRLIRRLIHASPVTIKRMLFPAGNNIILPGYDGTLEISGTHVHIPDNRSVWEIGTGNDPKGKANLDFAKRTNATNVKEQSELTFVFVTPYIFRDKDEWIESKKTNSSWKDIRVIDGLYLEEWLETLPSVGNWLAKLIGLPQGHALPLDQYWEEWRTNDKYSIPATLLLHGREKEKEALINFLSGPAGILHIKAGSVEEAKAFVAASLGQLPESEAEGYFSRAIFVNNEETLRDISCSRSPLLILSAPCSAGALRSAPGNGHYVIVLSGKEITNSAPGTFELPRIHRRGFEMALEEMGFDFEGRERAIRNSGLSLSVLRRQLHFDRFEQPAWASDGNELNIIPALLVGQWDEQNDADKELISELAGESYDSYIRKLARWKIVTDAPVSQVRSIWQITSPLDAWNLLAPFVTSSDLQKFRTAFLHASGELNPALELHIDQRYMANLLGKVPKYSNALKEGLAESLILIAVYGESFKISLHFSPQSFADGIIWQLLKEADGEKWCSFSDRLPLLAEASPEAFLKAVETSLRDDHPAIMQMFQEGNDPFYSSGSYHTGLLWALEGLAYSQEYLWRVTAVLGTLSRLDPGGRLSNRPINTLRQMNVPWYRQAEADIATRKAVLERLMQKEPDAAWQVFLSILPDPHGGHTSSIHSCRWRYATQLERTVTHQDVSDLHSFAIEKLMVLAKGDAKRAGILVGVYPDLSQNDRARLLLFFTDSKDEITDEENSVWDAFRKLLGKHRAHASTPWALREEELLKVETVFNLFAIQEGIGSVLYMFNDHWPEFPDGPRKWNTDEYGKFIHQKRTEGLTALYEKGGLSEILKMVPLLDDQRYLGASLAELSVTPEEEILLIKSIMGDPAGKDFQVSKFYMLGRSHKEGDAFTGHAWAILLSHDPTDKQEASFFLSLIPNRHCWSLIETRGLEVETEYWKKADVWLNNLSQDDRLYAIGKFQLANRHIMLIRLVSYFKEELSTEMIVRILVNAGTIRSEGNERFDDYPVCILIAELQHRTDINEEELFNLEWLYLSFLTNYHSQCKPTTLHKRLVSDPDYFTELVSILYWPDSGKPEMDDETVGEEEQQERYRRSDRVRTLLESFRTIPGTKEDGIIDESVLRDWINKTRSAAKEKGRVKGMDIEIGKLLACYPRNNELWPCETIAAIIDDLDSDTVIRNFETEIFNSRGTTIKNPYEGGGQERSLSEYFERMSNQLSSKYPLTAGALRSLANGYRRDGTVEDERAHLDELR